ncbi:MAG: hypothetical protein GY821_11055 [Gammaproteobacteria bacterium]|nr:hypothetical protein [Gammaproteobacteria bacterium]
MIKKILVCSISAAIFSIAVAKADTLPACPTGQAAENLAKKIMNSCPVTPLDCDEGLGRYHSCGYECGVKYDGACYVIGTYAKSFTAVGVIQASVEAITNANYNAPQNCRFYVPQNHQHAEGQYVEMTNANGPVWMCTPGSHNKN